MTATRQVMTGTILSHKEILPGHFRMTVSWAPSMETIPSPGQFVMVRRRAEDTPFLPRPFSVYDMDLTEGLEKVILLYRVAGKGTEIFSRMKRGETLSLIGPLGRGFTAVPEKPTLLLVGGGMGVVPLHYLARTLTDRLEKGEVSLHAYLGCGNSNFFPLFRGFKSLCSVFRVSTDDGSVGFKGTVMDLLEREVHRYDPARTMIYGCGPRPMLTRLAAFGIRNGVTGQLSMEERMACGVGACLGCAVSLKTAGGEGNYVRVCREGPVFSFDEFQDSGTRKVEECSVTDGFVKRSEGKAPKSRRMNNKRGQI
ncbi:MAG TPA: dihydroorotate dehydrogenase electron transfer subunit [Syntrophales bacterium]|nr:dihydroorotate dehydrogenase electron transfer subunit [Syntrophales bacterium]